MEKIEQITDLDRSNWINVPQEFSGLNYDFSVSPERLDDNPVVEKVGKNLNLNLKSTSKDSMYRNFIGNINQEQAVKINLLLGQKTPSTKQAIDFIHLLDEGSKGKIVVYNNAGKKLEKNYLAQVRDDIVKFESPWRAEWLEDKFTKENGKMKINNNYVMSKAGILVPQYSEILDKNTSMKNKRISLDSLFKTRTEQEMVSNKTEPGNLHFWAPVNGRVAWFYADVVRVSLGCDGDPFYNDSYLGVRGVKEEKQ